MYNMQKNYPCEVIITPFAEKQLKRMPIHIKEHVYYWAKSVEIQGISQVRKLPGYHDEPLKGTRKGQRSIRLNRSYRLIYEEDKKEEILVVGVMEVSKHEY